MEPMDYLYCFSLNTVMQPIAQAEPVSLKLCSRRTETLLAVLLCIIAAGQINAKSPATSADALPGMGRVEPSAGTSLPAGTRLFIRLDTAVSTQSSHLHAPVTARGVREVSGPDGVLVPLGAVASGSISKLIPNSTPTDRARLQLQFNRLEISGLPAISFAGHLVEVENAKETVLSDGTVQGILANELAITLIDSTLGKLGRLGEDAQKKVGKPNTTIEFPAGTDLGLVLDKPLEVNRTFPSSVPGKLPSDVRDAIARLLGDAPQRASGKTGKPGDPLNLIFIGSEAEILHAFEQAGWAVPEQSTGTSISRTTRAAIEDVGYRKAPVSDLYLYGKKEQLAFEKMFNTFAKRHDLRLWQSPVRTSDGRNIWLAAGTHDAGIDIHPGVVSHAIDPNIDLEREKVSADLMVTGEVAAEQLVTRPNPLSQGSTATGGTWSTDGHLRAIVLKPGT